MGLWWETYSGFLVARISQEASEEILQAFPGMCTYLRDGKKSLGGNGDLRSTHHSLDNWEQ